MSKKQDGNRALESLFAAVDAECGLSGHQVTLPPVEEREWRPGMSSHKEIIWFHALFGAVVVKSQYDLEEPVYATTNVRAEILIPRDEVKSLRDLGFKIEVSANSGVKTLFAIGNDVSVAEKEGIPDLVVNVDSLEMGSKGEQDEDGIPRAKPYLARGKSPQVRVHTRVKDKDNMDVILILPDGKFVELQVSLTTRRGAFWIAIQEVYSGQVVRTTNAKADQIGLVSLPAGNGLKALVVPLYPKFAYPGADYLDTFHGIGTQLVAYAVGEVGAFSQLSKATVARWEPEWSQLPESYAQKRFEPAVVDWFNLVTGFGKATTESGEKVFIHFNAIEDENGRQVSQYGFPALDPYEVVMVRRKESEPGKAKVVRPLPNLVAA